MIDAVKFWLLIAVMPLAANTVEFYGKNLELQTLSKINVTNFSSVNCKKIVVQWQKDNELQLQQLHKTAKNLNLDGMGIFLLSRKVILNQFKKENANQKKLMAFAIMDYFKMDVLLGLNNTYVDVYLHMPQGTDYGFYVTHKTKVYYGTDYVNGRNQKIELLQIDTISRKPITANLKSIPNLGILLNNKILSFTRLSKTYNATVTYNQQYVNYLNDLPALVLGKHLLNTQVESYMLTQLDDSMVVWTKGFSDWEKNQFILKLVQLAFNYKADRDYRPHEKRNILQQSLADKYVDCEDKAILYLFFVKRYTNTNGIMLYNKQKTHVNCAIEINPISSGHDFMYLNKKYILAEPAYVGYDIGESDFSKEDILNSKIMKED